MALTPEQVKELKDQLVSQVQNYPEDQKAAALEQIENLSPEALESMIQQQQSKSPGGKKSDKGVFRMIIDGEIPSKKIDENKDCIAVLDVKPISKGHTIIIPKKASLNTKDLPNSTFSMAKKISKRIIKKLKAKSTEIQTEFKFNELIINIIPVYDAQVSINSARKEGNEKELEKLQSELKVVKRQKTIKIRKTKSSQSSVIKLDRKIP